MRDLKEKNEPISDNAGTMTRTLSPLSDIKDPVNPDLSLRADARTYIEQDDEASIITNRIKSNVSSVIGIAGIRGAGKSSLALKVLEKCNTMHFFSMFVPSPTAYDPKEFLLTIYQALCEKVREDMEKIFAGYLTLEQTGKRIFKRRRRRLRFLQIGMPGISIFALFFCFNYVVNHEQLLETTWKLQMEQDSRDHIQETVNTVAESIRFYNNPKALNTDTSQGLKYEELSFTHRRLMDTLFRIKDMVKQDSLSVLRLNSGIFLVV